MPETHDFEERLLETRWTDFDIAGHITDVAYPVFFGNARGAFLAGRVGSFKDWPCVLARVEIDYRSEIPFPAGKVLVRTRVVEVGRRSVTFAQELLRKDGVVAATSRSVLVAWNPDERGSRDIEDDARALLLG